MTRNYIIKSHILLLIPKGKEKRIQNVVVVVGGLGLTVIWDSDTVYIGPSPREGERKERR